MKNTLFKNFKKSYDCGFVFTEIVQDEEIGDAWLWELSPAK